MRLSELGEFGLIKRIRAKCKNVSPEIIEGIGDDAAIIKTGAKKILVTTDMMIEGTHFDLSFTTFSQLGHKFLAVNISDIFAMGGSPEYFFISLGIPQKCKTEDIDELYSGILKLAKKSGVTIAGGDTCSSKDGLVLSGTLIGTADRIITRSGAKAGDGIFITDTVGDSAMGLILLKSQKSEVRSQKLKNKKLKFGTQNSKLIKKHLMPEPFPMKNMSKVTSMIDISDGLLIDLSHICDESKVGALIYTDKIPVSKELAEAAGTLRLNPVSLALKGGEDYALLFTAPQDIKTDAFKIGEIVKRGRFIVDEKGRKRRFQAEGYEHFKRK
ncbi:MAG: thiamine-phosphate kinase [Nitrospirae bacterium]|nr:thiamine-phosphate kinase [Nitrospirota bacterium]